MSALPRTDRPSPSFAGVSLDTLKFRPDEYYTLYHGPDRADRKYPQYLRHPVKKKEIRVPIPCRQRPNDQKDDPFGPLQETDICLNTESLGTRGRIADHPRHDHADACQEYIQERMLRHIAGIKHHYPQKCRHIGQPVECRIKKAAKLCNVA